jgi:hypothetical protein
MRHMAAELQRGETCSPQNAKEQNKNFSMSFGLLHSQD